jgi:cytochrome P450
MAEASVTARSAAVPVETIELPLLDVGGSDYERDPYGVIESLRSQHRLARTPRGYTVLDYALARELKRSPDFVRIFDAVAADESVYLHERARRSISSENGERLVLLRRLLIQALRPRNIANLQPAFGEIAQSLIDGFGHPAQAGPSGAAGDEIEVDLVGAFCNRYPGLVMGPILGVPFADTIELDEWATTINELGNQSRYGERIQVIEQAWRRLEDYLDLLIQQRRRQPGEDIVSDLVRAADAESALDPDDLMIVTVALVSAAVDNLRGQLALLLEALAGYPDVWQRVRAEHDLIPAAVEEGLRYAAQGDDIQHRVERDTGLGGVRFTAGTLVSIHKKAVNRDPSFAPDPHRFSVERGANQHLTFGVGLHACVGATLAREAMRAAVTALATRVEGLRLAAPVKRRTPVAAGGHAVELPVWVRFAAAAGATASRGQASG